MSYTDSWAAQQAPYMRSRLFAAGATADEIDAFLDQFVHDPEWDYEDKQRVFALGDAKLRAELLAARADGQRDTETEDEERARLANEERERLESVGLAEAERVSAWDPDQIVDWVGGDLDRARKALTIEEQHPQPRAGLVAALVRVLETNRG